MPKTDPAREALLTALEASGVSIPLRAFAAIFLLPVPTVQNHFITAFTMLMVTNQFFHIAAGCGLIPLIAAVIMLMKAMQFLPITTFIMDMITIGFSMGCKSSHRYRNAEHHS